MPQSDFLDPRWQKFRLERLNFAEWQCQLCGEKEQTLHVHHLFYVSGRKPWEYLPECTIVVCDECHEMQHDNTFEVQGAHPWEYRAAKEIQLQALYFRKCWLETLYPDLLHEKK